MGVYWNDDQWSAVIAEAARLKLSKYPESSGAVLVGRASRLIFPPPLQRTMNDLPPRRQAHFNDLTSGKPPPAAAKPVRAAAPPVVATPPRKTRKKEEGPRIRWKPSEIERVAQAAFAAAHVEPITMIEAVRRGQLVLSPDRQRSADTLSLEKLPKVIARLTKLLAKNPAPMRSMMPRGSATTTARAAPANPPAAAPATPVVATPAPHTLPAPPSSVAAAPVALPTPVPALPIAITQPLAPTMAGDVLLQAMMHVFTAALSSPAGQTALAAAVELALNAPPKAVVQAPEVKAPEVKPPAKTVVEFVAPAEPEPQPEAPRRHNPEPVAEPRKEKLRVLTYGLVSGQPSWLNDQYGHLVQFKHLDADCDADVLATAARNSHEVMVTTQVVRSSHIRVLKDVLKPTPDKHHLVTGMQSAIKLEMEAILQKHRIAHSAPPKADAIVPANISHESRIHLASPVRQPVPGILSTNGHH